MQLPSPVGVISILFSIQEMPEMKNRNMPQNGHPGSGKHPGQANQTWWKEGEIITVGLTPAISALTTTHRFNEAMVHITLYLTTNEYSNR